MCSRVAFIAAPYGFGPSAKAVAISSCLTRSVERVFLSQGPPLEMARRSKEFSAYFDLDFRNGPDAAARALRDFDVLVFINSTRFITATIVEGRPTILVETLAWLRDTPPPCASLLTAFFAQRFFDHAFAPALKALPYFQAVGPIVPQNISTAATLQGVAPQQTPIVHCGGLFSPGMIEGASEEFVTRTLAAISSFRGNVRAILPSHLCTSIRPTVDDRINLLACCSQSVDENIIGSEFALTTTGIEFTYESMLLGVPTLFLPPFNASQCFQVDYHAKACANSVPFNVRPSTPCEFDGLHKATAEVQQVGMVGGWQMQFAEVSHFLSRFGPEERWAFLQGVRRDQQRAIEGMRLDGAQIVASKILHEVGRDEVSVL
jgi:hypothetical protein